MRFGYKTKTTLIQTPLYLRFSTLPINLPQNSENYMDICLHVSGGIAFLLNYVNCLYCTSASWDINYQVSNLSDLLPLQVEVSEPVVVVGLLLLGEADEALGDPIRDAVSVQDYARHGGGKSPMRLTKHQQGTIPGTHDEKAHFVRWIQSVKAIALALFYDYEFLFVSS